MISLPALLTPGEPAEGFHVVSGFVRFDYNTETSPAAIAKLPATSRIWQELRQVVAAESTQSAELFDAIVEELRADEASRVTVPVAVQIQVSRYQSVKRAREPLCVPCFHFPFTISADTMEHTCVRRGWGRMQPQLYSVRSHGLNAKIAERVRTTLPCHAHRE